MTELRWVWRSAYGVAARGPHAVVQKFVSPFRRDDGVEQELLPLVRDGRLRVDARGRVWRQDGRRAEKPGSKGYLVVRATVGGRRVHALAHRLVYAVLVGPVPAGHLINHRNRRRDDNRPGNLEPRTSRANRLHGIAFGRRRTT